MDPVWLAGFCALGVFVGAYGTLIGAGGGFLIVPVLLLGLHWPHDRAVGTSLVVVTANALSGSIAYARQKRIDYRTGLMFAVATIPGAIVGSTVVHALSGRAFSGMFGALLVLVSTYLAIRPDPRKGTTHAERPKGPLGWGYVARHLVDAKGDAFDYGYSLPFGLALSFVVGFLSSILGIGGGIVHVPALVAIFGFPAHVATATSHFILAISAATGSVSHYMLGNVDVIPAAAMAVGAIIGAQIGGALSNRIHGRWIIRGLALALGLVGLRLAAGALFLG